MLNLLDTYRQHSSLCCNAFLQLQQFSEYKKVQCWKGQCSDAEVIRLFPWAQVKLTMLILKMAGKQVCCFLRWPRLIQRLMLVPRFLFPLEVMWDITVALPRRRSFTDVRQVCGCLSRLICVLAETLSVVNM